MRFTRTRLAIFALACVVPALGAQDAPVPPVPDPAGPPAGRPSVEELVRQGNEARRSGQMRLAIASYRKARDRAPRSYEIRVLLADTLRRSGDSERALPEYDAARGLDPSRPEGHTGRALILRSQYDAEGAAAVLNDGLQVVTPASRADLMLVLAETRRRQGRTGEAARLFAEILAIGTREIPARAGLARVAEDRGRIDEAIAAWDAYLALKPDDTMATLRRQEWRELRASIDALRETADHDRDGAVASEIGRLLAVAGDAQGSAAAYRKALRKAPDRPEARRGLALALRDLGFGHAAEAARAFRRVLDVKPGDAVTLYALAAIASSGADARAEDDAWRALIAARPDDLFAVRGQVAFLERRGPEAIERALSGTFEGPSGLRRRALLEAAAGRMQDAAGTLYRLLLFDPTDPWSLEVANDLLFLEPAILRELASRLQAEMAEGGSPPASPDGGPAPAAARRVLLARLTWWAGRADEALVILRQAVAADPRSAVARAALGEAFLEIGRDPGLALTELRRAVELDPSRAAVHVDLSLTLLRAGRPREAAAAARRGLQTAPGNAAALSVLAAALRDTGDFEEAVAAYGAALAADPADNFGLARGQLPAALAALGRNIEARRALAGQVAPIPELLYREAWAFARDVSRDRTFNGQDWGAWRTRYRGSLRTEDEAWRAIQTMLSSLGDPTTRLRDADETAAMYLARRGSSAETDALGRATPDSATVVAWEGADGLGYIRLSNFTDPRVVADLRAALESMRRKEGIVLDLRGNPGGLARSADAIGDLFVGPGKEAGTDDTAEGPVPQITGGDGALTEAPLTVLVDGQTGSAAERLARTLAQTGRGTLVGDPTFGKGRAQMTRVLPGGMTVLVSTSEMLDADGRPLQGRGLAPGGRMRIPEPPGRPVPPPP